MKQNIKCFLITVFLIAVYSIHVHASDPMLKWDASTGDVSGYKIYYGLSQGNYPFSDDVGNVTQYSLSNFSLSEGTTYYFVVRAYNASGESDNSNVTTYSVPDSLDTTPPLSPQGVAGKIANDDIVLTWKANSESDFSVYRVYYGTSSRDYGLPIPVNRTKYSISGLNSNVTYYLAVTAVDTSGNESGYSSPEIQKIIIPEPIIPEPIIPETIIPEPIIPETDTQAPSVFIRYPTYRSSYDTTTSSVDISGTASDDTGVTEVTWSNSKGGSGIATGTSGWSAKSITLDEGKNLITVTATDKAGNTSTDKLTITYIKPDLTAPVVIEYTKPDTTAPVVTITSPTSGTTYGVATSSLNIAGTASDAEGVTQVAWSNSRGGSGKASGTNTWSAKGIILGEGANLITVTATDVEGNASTDTLTITYTIPDTTIPDTTIPDTTTNSWVELTNDNFESGWGNFQDGGRHCRRVGKSLKAHQGNYSIRIRSNHKKGSSLIHRSGIDVKTPDYSQIKIEFWFLPVGMDKKDKFFVEYHDGNNWQKVAQYAVEKDFTNESFHHKEIIIHRGPNFIFSKNMRIRFQNDSNKQKDRIYIDEVIVSAR